MGGDQLTIGEGPGDTVEEGVKRRFGDPIIGSYIVSFFIYNWKLTLILASFKEVDQKILILQGYLREPHVFFVPLIACGLVLFGLPIALRRLYLRLLIQRVTFENDRFDAEQKLSPISKRIKFLEEQNQLERQRISDLNQVIAAQKETIESQRKSISESELKIKNLKAGGTSTTRQQVGLYLMDSKQENAYKFLLNNSLLDVFVEAASKLTLQPQPLENFRSDELTKFLAMELVKKQRTGARNYIFLTDLGRQLYKAILESS